MIPVARRSFATLADVKLRMRSVGSIQKITKSMKMVAASKLKAVQTNLEKARPFAKGTKGVFAEINEINKETEPKAKKVMIVAVTSDRGLCGAINSGIVKLTKLEAKKHEDNGSAVELVLIGEKGRSALVREKKERIAANITEVGKTPVTFLEAQLISEKLIKSDADKIVILHNRFKSAIAYDTVALETVTKSSLGTKIQGINAKYSFDSDCLIDLFEHHVANSLYSALLENATSEQSARMTAMDNASSNAGDMLSKLRLKYNRTRQAVITRELIEIISGADAIEK